MGLGVDWAVDWLKLSAKAMAEHRTELIELDRAIGDSDHGENMDRGFQAVLQKLDEAPPETPGAALKAAAMALMSRWAELPGRCTALHIFGRPRR